MEPKAFLDLAQNLSKEEKNEASLRSSVSRSYYSLFHVMQQFFVRNGERIPKGPGAHGALCNYLSICNLSEVQRLAMDLNSLRTERNDSDYDLESDRFKEPNTVVLLFCRARSAFNDFEKIISSPDNRRHIMNGVQKYKNSIRPHQP
jgi:uncharacterized protein (UPF0332 family)